MAIDDSFKKPGSIPFKWEIKPGVPKQPQAQHKKSAPPPPPPRQKLRPPPLAAEPRPTSFRSAPRAPSDRWRLVDRAVVSEAVAVGCFSASATTPRLNRKPSAKTKTKSDDVETSRRWSVSSRKSVVLPFGDSPRASFYGSSSSRPVSDHSEFGGFKFF